MSDVDESAGVSPFGTDFDDYLAERGVLEKTRDHATKAVFAMQLERERKARGVTKKQFAEMVGTSRSQLDRMLDPENGGVTLESLERAAAVLGKRVRLELVDNGRAVDDAPDFDEDWVRSFPLGPLRKVGVIPKGGDVAATGRALLGFFGAPSRAAYDTGWARASVAHRHSKSKASGAGALRAWLRLGQIEAERATAPAFDPGALVGIVPEIRRLTLEEPAGYLAALPELCRPAGVVVAVVPAIDGARLSGAAYRTPGGSGVIQISLRHGYNDHFWFTFFHEAGHLVLHDRDGVFADDGDAVAEGGIEVEADEFAEDTLVGREAFARFCGGHPRSEAQVAEFARRVGIHPGIVVGMLQHRQIVPWTHLNRLKQKVELAD